MMNRHSCFTALFLSLTLAMSIMALNLPVKKVKAIPDPWDMPVVYLHGYNPTPNTTQIHLAIYNLSDSYYPTDERWYPGSSLPPYASGPVSRYNYSLGSLAGLDVSIHWNPLVLQYVSRTNPPDMGVVFSQLDTVAGTYRIAAFIRYPAHSIDSPADAWHGFTMTFDILEEGDEGLAIDSVVLVASPFFSGPWGRIGGQPDIPYRTVLDPHLPHNVAVEGAPRNKDIVGQGYEFYTYLLLSNKGDFPETFDVTLYADSTIIGEATTSVNARSIKKLRVACSTTALPKGTYNFKAVVAPVPDEAYLGDNALPFGSFFVTLPGDVDGDRDVDIFDLVKMAQGYGSRPPNPAFDPCCDIENNNVINIYDLVISASNYGDSW